MSNRGDCYDKDALKQREQRGLVIKIKCCHVEYILFVFIFRCVQQTGTRSL